MDDGATVSTVVMPGMGGPVPGVETILGGQEGPWRRLEVAAACV